MTTLNSTLIQPFLKWAGGKRQLLPKIRKYYPDKFNRYFEPFVGAGAVFMDLKYDDIVINDLNEDLINAYNAVKDDVDNLVNLLKKHAKYNNKEHYYKVRQYDRDGELEKMSDTARAARFIYLNKTCFNGLYRVNSKGQFNVPFGDYKNPNIVNETVLKSVSYYFNENKVEILNTDYKKALEGAKAGDFIYLDPPYAPIDEKQSFVSYTSVGFDLNDQEELRDVFVELDKKGCYVMLSNSSVPIIHELYKEYKDTTKVLGATRMINSNAKGRGKVDEVLVMNYKKDD